jgi:hypothetical protein
LNVYVGDFVKSFGAKVRMYGSNLAAARKLCRRGEFLGEGGGFVGRSTWFNGGGIGLWATHAAIGCRKIPFPCGSGATFGATTTTLTKVCTTDL